MSHTSLDIHPKDHNFSSEVTTHNEGQPGEFHVLKIHPDDGTSIKVYFQDDASLITALQDLKVMCENKIWDLTAVPSEYEDYAREPF